MKLHQAAHGFLAMTVALVLVSAVNAQGITQIIDATGDGVGNGLNESYGIAVDGLGNAYVAGLTSSNVFKVTPTGTITEIIDSTGDGAGNGLGGPTGVAADDTGNVYVVGAYTDNAFRISPTGVITLIKDSTGFDHPFGVAVDDSGNAYVTGSSSDNAFKITPSGTVTEIIDSSGDGAGNTLWRPAGIAVDGSGNVYVAGINSDNVFKVSPGGAIVEIIDEAHLYGPLGVAADQVGNVYVTSLHNDRAFRIDPSGSVTTIITGSGDGHGNTLAKPHAIAVGEWGNVYVTGGATDNAFKVTPDGVVAEIIDSTGDKIGHPFGLGEGIAVDNSGNVYVPSQENDNAFRIDAWTTSPPGTGYCFGDPGSGTPCPCGNDNDGSVPGSGCDNGVFASGARLSGWGIASVGWCDSLVLTASHLEPHNAGLFFQANADLSPGLVWGDGIRCAGHDLIRLEVLFANAAGTSSTTIPIAAKGLVAPGDTKYYQLWYRTVAFPPCGHGVNDFNTTNGYMVRWWP